MSKKAGRPQGSKANKPEMRNFVISLELHDEISALADSMEPVLGFRPTKSQTVKYLISEYKRIVGAKA